MPLSSEQDIQEILSGISTDATVVFVSGYFNIIHPGHLRLLQYAASQGNCLVVGVLSDALVPTATTPEWERTASVGALSMVDRAVLLHEPPEVFVMRLRPALVVKGWEFRNSDNPEKAAVESGGGQLLFSSGETTFSSLDLIQQQMAKINFSAIEKPADFPARHGFDLNILQEIIQRFQNMRVCVIGDVIVDEYLECDPIGMSQEDPTIVVRPIHSRSFLGGAGIVAGHAAALGARVHFFSVVGDDEFGRFAHEQLNESAIISHVLTQPTRKTTHKRRYRASGKTMLRVNTFTEQPLGDDTIEEMVQAMEAVIGNTDLVVFSDFNYGILPQPLVDEIVKMAQRNGVPTVADSQSSSQVGDISRFSGARLITPTEREARLALHDFENGLVTLAEKLRIKTKAEHVFITLGSEGLLVHTTEVPVELKGAKWLTDRLPALNMAPKDPAGAGDALLIASSLALASGAKVWEAAYLGAIAAACQVGRVGNIPLTHHEILMELNT